MPVAPDPCDPGAFVFLVLEYCVVVLSNPACEAALHSSPGILLVEDNDGDIELWRFTLEELGLDTAIEVVSDGLLALARLRDRHKQARAFRLVISDRHLPRLNGPELVARLRADPDLSATPVVILSGTLDGMPPVTECLWLEKPCGHVELSHMVRKLQASHAQAFEGAGPAAPRTSSP